MCAFDHSGLLAKPRIISVSLFHAKGGHTGKTVTSEARR
jgi:hypothetical protein